MEEVDRSALEQDFEGIASLYGSALPVPDVNPSLLRNTVNNHRFNRRLRVVATLAASLFVSVTSVLLFNYAQDVELKNMEQGVVWNIPSEPSRTYGAKSIRSRKLHARVKRLRRDLEAYQTETLTPVSSRKGDHDETIRA